MELRPWEAIVKSSEPDYEARTIDELLYAINPIEEDTAPGIDHFDRLWYRGQGSIAWPLRPSIQRHDLSEDEERGLVNDFYVRASHVTELSWARRDDYATWLAKAQHYGIPTRLLDWSASPLVAAFFSVEEDLEADACVWVLRPGALNGRNNHTACLHPLDSHTAVAMMQTAFVSHEEEWLQEDGRDVLACYAVGRDPRVYGIHAAVMLHHPSQARCKA